MRPGALAAWRALADEFPADPDLSPFDVLARALEAHSDVRLQDHDALARERHLLAEGVSAAARQALGSADADAWLRPMWRALAVRAVGLSFQAARADDHAAVLWLRGEDWSQAVLAAQGIESWRRIPAPLAWAAEARCRLGGLDESWPLLAELAWLAPSRLDALLRRQIDPLLSRLHKAFGATFEGAGDATDAAWFPAWVLTRTPALAPHLAQAWPSQQGAPERGMRLVLELLGLERPRPAPRTRAAPPCPARSARGALLGLYGNALTARALTRHPHRRSRTSSSSPRSPRTSR